jgi:DNA-binding SARP family transcriptional activator/predicted nucleotidyltransferase
VGVEFGILGPLQALVDGTPVSLGGRQQRAVLAILLTQANQTVPVDRLIDDVWDDSPPETAGNLLQGYVSQLRKALGKDVIATRGRGYAVVVPTGGLDLHRFEQRAEAGMAERSTGSAEKASAELTTALALWRGPALSDLADLPRIAPIAARLDALRLAAIEHRLEADLDCGREDEVAAELDALIAEHPLREPLRRLRMLALYRAGRQAEALETYRAARETLVEELGIEPSEELGELERAILSHDPDLLPRAGGTAVAPEAPAQTRTILIAALAMRSVGTLVALGGSLARHPDRELVLASTVSRSEDLLEVTKRLREATAPLQEQDVVARVAAFTSVAPGADVARLATEQDVDILLVDAPEGLLEDARLLSLLDDTPCDVAVVVGDHAEMKGPVLVPFSGFEHDWAAVELGAWFAQALECPIQLAGPSIGPGGRDASRLLASASLVLQKALRVEADPLIVEPSPAALVAAAGDAGLVIVGLTERWRREGLGGARTALATAPGLTTLLVRRGLRPGGLAPQTSETRFTWTVGPTG